MAGKETNGKLSPITVIRSGSAGLSTRPGARCTGTWSPNPPAPSTAAGPVTGAMARCTGGAGGMATAGRVPTTSAPATTAAAAG